ncbi:Hypothetical predicted protein [Olea europaea subsp. europaea]|uniref:Uncharacterized protein n=1 Tax=Olea europaea subsp. europaea TaxID=158383 RepID=A0A8S0SY71_OLEEU|nr:Hypothetical predicted protein [Olea europaea subsp. europaea]
MFQWFDFADGDVFIKNYAEPHKKLLELGFFSSLGLEDERCNELAQNAVGLAVAIVIPS